MFRGRYEHTIDAKGRVSFPVRFRQLLQERYDGRLIIAKFDECLVAYPFPEWLIFEEKAKGLSQVSEDVTAFLRYFYSSAMECPLDKLGRILIPPPLREFAGLGRDVVFAGMINRVEIWSKERFVQADEQYRQNFAEIRRTLAGLGL